MENTVQATHVLRLRNAESKSFATSTLAGLKSAERFKANMERKYQKVQVVGSFFRVTITGTQPIR